jgi:hypothetical protein
MADPTTPAVPTVPVTPTVDPNAPKQPDPNAVNPMAMENDPNLKLQKIVSRRKEPKEQKKEETPKVEKPEEGDEEPKEPTVAETKQLSGLIGKALGFKQDKPADEKKPKEEKPKDEKPPDKKKDDQPKTIVRPKKSDAPATPNLADVASAAATAAVRAIQPAPKAETTVAQPEDSLPPSDRHEYEVAKYLSTTNERFKGAEAIVLDHIKKTEQYATRWEAANQGKVFDPYDDEHNEFYAKLDKEKPWSAHEFETAKIAMEQKKQNEPLKKEYDEKLKKIEQKVAQQEVSHVVQRAYTAAAGLLAKKVDEAAHETIIKKGFAELEESDPVMADVLASNVGQLQPIIEAAIQLDDPHSRFPVNPKNPVHLEWSRRLVDIESRYHGSKDEKGRTFATRADWINMPPEQQARHWFITTEHFIEELVNDAATNATEDLKTQRERIKKAAERMGYVPKAATNGEPKKSDTPKKEDEELDEEPANRTAKPESPSAGGGAKIDDTAAHRQTADSKLMEVTGNILFGR